VKKILPWLILALAVLWIIHNPAGAAQTIKSLLTGASTFASNL
jgi:hypothetical protein